jgi:multidrug transporter EmrE-like cation transporter
MKNGLGVFTPHKGFHLINLLVIIFFVFTTVMANILIKNASANLSVYLSNSFAWDRLAVRILTDGVLLGGILFYGIAFLCYAFILKTFDLNIATAIGAVNIATLILIGKFWFGEYIPPLRWIGFFMIILGVLFVAASRR